MGNARKPVSTCPICRSESSSFCEKTDRGQTWHIRKCVACGHGFVSNRPSLEFLADLYARDPTHHPMRNMDVAQIERRGDCQSLASRVARLSCIRGEALDIGCGDGAFSYHLARHGFQSVMIDLDPRARQAAALVQNATLKQVLFEDFVPDRPLAAIVMSQVLEHALDPLAWLRRAASFLEPQGILAVAVPNFEGVYRLLGTRDPFLIPPRHLNYFTERSLRLAFGQTGLRHLRSESRSDVSLGGKLSAVGAAWNGLASPLLNLTKAGVVLREYATPG